MVCAPVVELKLTVPTRVRPDGKGVLVVHSVCRVPVLVIVVALTIWFVPMSRVPPAAEVVREVTVRSPPTTVLAPLVLEQVRVV